MIFTVRGIVTVRGNDYIVFADKIRRIVNGLFNDDQALLPLESECRIKVAFPEKRVGEGHLAERPDKLFGYRLVLAGDRENEMDIRMDQLRDPVAGRAVQILQESERDRERSAAVILVKQQGVRNAPAVDHPPEGADNGIISQNVR